MGQVAAINAELEYIIQWKQKGPTQYLVNSSKQLPDVVLAHVDGTLIPVHRSVLAVSSAYFAHLLGQLMGSGFLNSNTVVVIKDISIETLKDLVNFMYEGKVIVKQSRLKEFLLAAVQLKVYGLVEHFLPEGHKEDYSFNPSPSKSDRSTLTFDSGLDLQTETGTGVEELYSDGDFASPSSSPRSTSVVDSGQDRYLDREYLSPNKSHVNETSTSRESELESRNESPAQSSERQTKEKAGVKRAIDKKTTKKRARNYRNYTVEQLEEALKDVKEGMACTKAGLKHSVPSRTLYQIIANRRAANGKDDNNLTTTPTRGSSKKGKNRGNVATTASSTVSSDDEGHRDTVPSPTVPGTTTVSLKNGKVS